MAVISVVFVFAVGVSPNAVTATSAIVTSVMQGGCRAVWEVVMAVVVKIETGAAVLRQVIPIMVRVNRIV